MTSTIKLPMGAVIGGGSRNCTPGGKVEAGDSCLVSLEDAICTPVHCPVMSTNFSKTTCRPACTVQGTGTCEWP